jgi:hypothetical protein
MLFFFFFFLFLYVARLLVVIKSGIEILTSNFHWTTLAQGNERMLELRYSYLILIGPH